jgi:hypothetical protein
MKTSAEGSGDAVVSAEEPEAEALTEIARVVRWRRDQLRGLGFADIEADLLADCPEVDLGRVRTLVHTGCPLGLALRIVI